MIRTIPKIEPKPTQTINPLAPELDATRIEVTAYLDNSDNNRNNPNDPPIALQFAEPLCEIALTQEAQLKSASNLRGGRKGETR